MQYAEKILMAVHKALECWQVRPRGVVPEAALKILIPYGNTERPDKLGKIMPAARLDGHQNFSE
jgi:hypothetical protein